MPTSYDGTAVADRLRKNHPFLKDYSDKEIIQSLYRTGNAKIKDIDPNAWQFSGEETTKQAKFDEEFSDFRILKSKTSKKLSLEIPSDVGMCKECEAELRDKNNRRFNYPFINCINCGPRFSIIKNLPSILSTKRLVNFKKQKYHILIIHFLKKFLKISLLKLKKLFKTFVDITLTLEDLLLVNLPFVIA